MVNFCSLATLLPPQALNILISNKKENRHEIFFILLLLRKFLSLCKTILILSKLVLLLFKKIIPLSKFKLFVANNLHLQEDYSLYWDYLQE